MRQSSYCKECLWGDKCGAEDIMAAAQCGCDDYTPLQADHELECAANNIKREYEWAWRDYIAGE